MWRPQSRPSPDRLPEAFVHYMLPGGLWLDGHLAREVTLQPFTGGVEQALAERFAAAASWPEFVSAALTASVATIGARAGSAALVEALAVGDRQYLLLRVAAALHGDRLWASAPCARCGAWFDLGLRRLQLPVKPAGTGYPFTELDDHGRHLRLRVPTGADQCQLPGLEERAAIRALLQACLLAVDGAAPPPDFALTLDDETVARIEAALDEVAPEVGTCVQTRCPECDAAQLVEIDPYGGARWLGEGLYEEVHAIACRYHWGETEILALPRTRRRLYLGLIEQAHALSH